MRGRIAHWAVLGAALPPGSLVEPLGGIQVKEAPVESYVVVELPPDGS